MKTKEQLEEALKPEREKLDKLKKEFDKQGRKVYRLRNKINTLETESILGEGDIIIENVMKLDWGKVGGNLHGKISDWLSKNLRYLYPSGHFPYAGGNGQISFYIKMNRGHDVEPQIEEINRIIKLTNWLDYSKSSQAEPRMSNGIKGPMKHFSLFVGSGYQEDDGYTRYAVRVYENGRMQIFINEWCDQTFTTIGEGLRFIHRTLWYEDKE